MILLFSANCSKKKPDGLRLGVLALAAGGGSSSSSSSNNATSTVKPTVPKSNQALITAFSIKGTEGNITNQKISFSNLYSATQKLKATFTISKRATINPDPTKENDYTNPVTFAVTAEDGKTTKKYEVNVTIEKPILSWKAGWKISENDFTATINGNKINIDVDSANFTTTISPNTGTTIEPDPKTVTDWTKEVDFTAKKGAKSETYKVKVKVKGKDVINVTDSNIQTIINTEIGKHGDSADYNHIDVSTVTSMKSLFLNKTNFNGDITKWDVSKVKTMRLMFAGLTNFNQNIGSWNTSNVTNMVEMFRSATSFNQNISNWNVNKVTDCFTFAIGANAFQNVNKPTFISCRP